MINGNRLFLVPALSSILVFVPIIGILLWLGICLNWYSRNKNDIHIYCRGQNYRQNETSDKVIDEFK